MATKIRAFFWLIGIQTSLTILALIPWGLWFPTGIATWYLSLFLNQPGATLNFLLMDSVSVGAGIAIFLLFFSYIVAVISYAAIALVAIQLPHKKLGHLLASLLFVVMWMDFPLLVYIYKQPKSYTLNLITEIPTLLANCLETFLPQAHQAKYFIVSLLFFVVGWLIASLYLYLVNIQKNHEPSS